MTTSINQVMEERINFPRNMHFKKKSGSLVFSYSWFKIKYLIAFFTAPLFTYFLVNSEYIAGNFNHLTISAILLIISASIIFYYSLAKLINTTSILVTHKGIIINHRPLPFGKNLVVKRDFVTQLYVTQHRVGHRYYLYATTYQINAILKNKEVITLAKGLHSAEQGRFIENQIEDFLNITDIHVAGELAKN